MQTARWQLDGNVARLSCGDFTAKIDLTKPADGLADNCLGGGRPVSDHLLAIAIPSVPQGDTLSPSECYVRGCDLVAAYKESAARPVHVEVLWRVFGPAPSEEFLAAVELVVSVRTHVLESRPELAVQSDLPVCETLRLRDAESADFNRLAPPPEATMEIQPAGGPGCVLFRLAGGELSYAEMVHPADFRSDELVRLSDDDGTVRVVHHLFSGRLEKGVILRARLQGVFLPRRDDAQIAAPFYRAFATAEPPLGT